MTMTYKGYAGSSTFDAACRLFHGRVEGIDEDLTFEGATPDKTEQAFRETVDAYLSRCEREGREPEGPGADAPLSTDDAEAKMAEEESPEETSEKPDWQRWLWALPGLAAFLYVTVNHIRSYAFCPIDDSYIHLQFIVNYAAGHGLAFNVVDNVPEFSFGCTSYLYVVILGWLHWLFSGVLGWEYDPANLLRWFGVASGIGVLLLVWQWLRPRAGWVVGAAMGLCFLGAIRPFTATAASGMETTFYTAGVLLHLMLVNDDRVRVQALAGLLGGLLYLVRPDAVLCVAWFLVARVLHIQTRKEGWNADAGYGFAWHILLLSILPILFTSYCHAKTGFPLPTTHSSKIFHHAPWLLDCTFSERWAAMIRTLNRAWENVHIFAPYPRAILFAGIFARLIGVIPRLWRGGDRWAAAEVAAFGYGITLPILFSWSFPVGGSFGGWYLRYLQPAFPFFVILQVLGLFDIVRWLTRWFGGYARVLERTGVALIGITLIFWTYKTLPGSWEGYRLISDGKNAYRYAVAEWVDENLPQDARVAIGAPGLGVIGYRSHRYIIDIAGLIDHRVGVWYGRPEYRKDLMWGFGRYMAWRKADYYVHTKDLEGHPWFEKVAEIPNNTGIEMARVGFYSLCVYAFNPPDEIREEVAKVQ